MNNPALPLFLDTTIKVDQVFKAPNALAVERISTLLGQYGLHFACTFSRLEYKRVVLQNLALALRYLVEEESYFAALQRTQSLQNRKKDALVSIFAWLGHKVGQMVVTQGGELDQELTLRSQSYIRTNLAYLWHSFKRNTELTDATKCQRAAEAPVKRDDGAYDLVIHEKNCEQRQCNNGGFFQSQLYSIKKLCKALEAIKASGGTLSAELETALSAMQEAIETPSVLYNYQKCLRIGDVWIHLEALKAGVKDFATTNYKESDVLCPILGLRNHNPHDP